MTDIKKDGGPAFPQSETLYEDGAMLSREQFGGMSLRDWFAGQALTALVAEVRFEHLAVKNNTEWGDLITVMAYLFADKMLEARESELRESEQ